MFKQDFANLEHGSVCLQNGPQEGDRRKHMNPLNDTDRNKLMKRIKHGIATRGSYSSSLQYTKSG